MPIVGELSHMIPNHFVRVGQSVRVDPVQKTVIQSPSSMEPTDAFSDPELDMALDNLNHLILELDPTFEPIEINHSPTFPSLHTDDSVLDEDVSNCVLVPRGCSPCSSSPSRSIPISPRIGASCSPHGSLVFSGSPSSSRPPLPCGVVHRRSPSTRNEFSLRTSSNRNSTISLLSTSPGSDTSYMIGSCLSLTSDDGDSPESLLSRGSGSFSNMSTLRSFDTKHSPDKPSPTKRTPLEHFQGQHCNGSHSSPASLSGSLTDIPVLLVNGTPEPRCQPPPGPDAIIQSIHVPHSSPSSHHSFQAPFHGSQPSMKFVMDTSKYWFRPHINRAEAEAQVKDKEPGSFVVRDSTSYRGSFGLAMRVQQVPANLSPTNMQGENSADLVRHFLIESSPKGVRVKGSSQEPYFGSLSALVYQHTITAYALPCKLLLQSHDLCTTEERTEDTASEGKTKTASNFLYLNAVSTEMLTGPCAVERAVSSTLQKDSSAITPTVVNLKVSSKGVTLTDIQRKLFFRRHYPAHLLSYSGEDPEKRQWLNGSGVGARIFGIVAKGTEAGMENVCHVFAEYDALQPFTQTIEMIESAKP